MNTISSKKFTDFYQKPTDFSLCFSGGIDSTFIACYFGLKYHQKVHLVTMDHGYGNIFPWLRLKHIKNIEDILGKNAVIHQLVYTRDFFNEILLNSIKDDYVRYKSNFIWCLGCTLALHAYMMVYNVVKQIPRCFYGSSLGGDGYAVMSIPVTVEALKVLYSNYGISFNAPILDLGIIKKDEKKFLRRLGIWPGLVVGRGTLGVQPVCLPGFAQHFKDVLFDIHPIYDNDKVADFIRRKTPIIKKIVERNIKNGKSSL